MDKTFETGKKLVEPSDGLLVRRAAEQILGLAPQWRIEYVAAVLPSIKTRAQIKLVEQPVPQMVRVGVVEGWRLCLRGRGRYNQEESREPTKH